MRRAPISWGSSDPVFVNLTVPYGEVRDLIHAEYKGQTFVAVGNTVLWGKWRTFTDFLIDYVWHVFGKDWVEQQFALDREDRHPVARMREDVSAFAATQEKGPDGLYESVATGPMAGFLYLAYDLYVLAHHQDLQAAVVRRLRLSEQYQGARHELFAAATCIRAGFELEHEDETDRSRKHPEFVATHTHTGQVVAVEAKSRHRAGVLGRKGERESEEVQRADVGRLLNKAIAKRPGMPYVIFMDLNLPPLESDGDQPLPRVMQELPPKLDRVRGKHEDGKDPYNLLVFSNHPHHYGEPLSPDPAKDVLAVESLCPEHSADHPETIRAIYDAANQYGNVPSKFPEGP